MANIVRVEHNKEKPYVQISRKTLYDVDLDLYAKGLLVFLLSKPDDWRIRPEQLACELKIGRATIYRILERLLNTGYLHREIVKRNKDGTFSTGSIYIVFEDKEERREWEDKERFRTDEEHAQSVFAINNAEIPF